MKKKKDFSFLMVTGVSLSCFVCTSVDTASINKTEFVPPAGSNPKYQQSKRFFLLYPNDTALLYGTAACTCIVDGVITSAAIDSVYLRTITRPEERMSINDTEHIVSPQSYRTSAKFSSLDGSGVTLYFKRTVAGVLLLAKKENGLLTYIPDDRRTVVPNPLDMGSYGTTNSPQNNWATYPCFPSPLRDLKGILEFEARSVATAAIALEASSPPYRVRDYYYYDGVEIVTYHSINGSGTIAGKEAACIGTVVITSHYFKDKGLVDQYERWNIQTIFSDGRTEIVKKSIWIGRGPEGAKTYPDSTENRNLETASRMTDVSHTYTDR